MNLKVEMDKALEERIDSVIRDVKQKQDEGKIELYHAEMDDMLKKHGQLALIACGCQVVRSAFKGYIVLPQEYIEDIFIPSLKAKIAFIIKKNEG